jgi:hypothetical protein
VSRIKNISRSGWLVIGIVAALLLVPTTVAAVTSTTIIKGGTLAGQAGVTASHQLQTNGEIQGTSGNQADVSPAGQVLSAPAYPSHYFAGADAGLPTGGSAVALATPPAGGAMVVTSVNVSVYSAPSPGPSDFAEFVIGSGGCTTFVGPFEHAIYPSGIGSTQLTFDPGVVIPSGDVLCGGASVVGAYADATGYTVPAAAG